MLGREEPTRRAAPTSSSPALIELNEAKAALQLYQVERGASPEAAADERDPPAGDDGSVAGGGGLHGPTWHRVASPSGTLESPQLLGSRERGDGSRNADSCDQPERNDSPDVPALVHEVTKYVLRVALVHVAWASVRECQ